MRHESLLRTCITILLAGTIGLGTPVILGANSTANFWVHGSWVNLRAKPTKESAIVGHLTSNTAVSVLNRSDGWCQVRSAVPAAEGFVACQLLGNAPLVLEQIGRELLPDNKPNPAYSPTRAFWIAPSVNRLIKAGQYFESTMLPEKQRKAEQPDDPISNPETMRAFENKVTPRRFPIAEFDAMKQFLEKGTVAAPENRQQFVSMVALKQAAMAARQHSAYTLPQFVERDALQMIDRLNLKPPGHSLFRRNEDLASASATVEQMSAQFSMAERMKVLEGPKWDFVRHQGPHVAGSWDIGYIELDLNGFVYEYVFDQKGNLATYKTRQNERIVIGKTYDCWEGYRLRWLDRDKVLVLGQADTKDPLIWFYLTSLRSFKSARIDTRVEPLGTTLPPLKNSWVGTVLGSTNHKKLNPENSNEQLISHFIDLDADGVPDLLVVWVSTGREQDEADKEPREVVPMRMYFANVNGEWRLLDTDSFNAMCD